MKLKFIEPCIDKYTGAAYEVYDEVKDNFYEFEDARANEILATKRAEVYKDEVKQPEKVEEKEDKKSSRKRK